MNATIDALPADVRRALADVRGTRGAAVTSPGSAALAFAPDAPLFVARAPGRLDLMGGIADYSGGAVLQMPIAEAAVVVLQRTDEPTLEIASVGEGRDEDGDGSDSDSGGDDGGDGGSASTRHPPFRCRLDALLPAGGTDPVSAARAVLRRDPSRAWAAYVAGVFPVLAERGTRFGGGARLLVRSAVPVGKGVSSSAALEVATMRAVAAAWDIPLDAHACALLCQRVENAVVGAPCGLMDQMTSSAGRNGRLLSLLCQPDRLLPDVTLPPTLAAFGIDSGIRHSVGGSDYGRVRAGAFMGYRLLLAHAAVAAASVPAREVVDTRWRGYLANVTPSELDGELAGVLPARLSGADFLARFDATTDPLSRIEPDVDYAVRHPTEHPVREHFRVQVFRRLLAGSAREAGAPVASASAHRTLAALLGECLYQSHASYSACGLGSDGTDRLVALAREAGAAAGIHGARITGGGSGGTVAILAERGAGELVRDIAARYRQERGHAATVFDGSSDGARAWRLDPSPAGEAPARVADGTIANVTQVSIEPAPRARAAI